ncbi:MAG: M67 family metallopeptidase [Acidimicrobiia bacterium]|nr:M67 family metallopeptidase [Acidimicrobiia bacterium]
MRRLLLPAGAAEAIRTHEMSSLPEECCGLLAGEKALAGNMEVVRFVYPLTNLQHSPTAFTIDPVEHFRSWKHSVANGWDLIGAFHSHTDGPDHPSRTDLALANEPDWAYLIVSKGLITAWEIRDRVAQPLGIEPD